MMAAPQRSISRGVYRIFLLLYPPSFRREYGALMLQAFNDRLREKGAARTWLLVIPDLVGSIPQQILEVSFMSQKWMAALTAVGVTVMLAGFVVGSRLPLFLIGGVFAAVSLLALGATKRSGRPAEYLYGGNAPRRWTWWTVLAALLGATYVTGGVGQLINEPKATNVGALGFAIAFAGMIALGLRLRSRSRVSGNWLVIAATAPALALFWMIVPAVIGLAIIVGALIELAKASPKAPLAA